MPTVTRRFALWTADLAGGVCAAPEECVEALSRRDRVPLVIEHRVHGRAPATRSFETALRQDVEWQFTGVEWPADLQPGALVTVAWRTGAEKVVVRSTPLDEPVRVDGVDYFHEYDPRVATRECPAADSNRGQVLHAVRRHGRVFSDGSAVLAEPKLAGHCGLGRGAKGQFLLRNAVDQLIREGYLTRVDGSVDSAGYPSYPPAAGQKTEEMLFYAPMVEPAPDPEGDADRREHWVNGFSRKLPPGATASEKQASLHEQLEQGPLTPGYTYVQKHHRNG